MLRQLLICMFKSGFSNLMKVAQSLLVFRRFIVKRDYRHAYR